MDRKRRGQGFDGPPNKKGRDGGDNNRDTEHLRKIFIGGLSVNTTEEGLKSHFGEWGEIVDCVVMRDPNSKRSRGFGFVTYKFPEDVDKAQEARPHSLDGKEVETKRATPREESNKPEARMSIKKVFVGGIKEDLEQADLQEYFSQYGDIQSVDIITEKATGKKRGFAFILYDDYDPVDKIVLKRSHYIKNHRCDVKKALSKEEMQKAKEKEMQMNARRDMGRDMGGMGGRGNFDNFMGGGGFDGFMGGNDMGGRGGRGNMGGDSDFRGNRGGGFGGNQSNGYNQGGGYNSGNMGGGGSGFNDSFSQGGGFNQSSQGWGNQGGGSGGGWGNQSGNQSGFGNQGMGNMGGQGSGGWGNQSSGYNNQGGNMGGGASGYGGGYNDNFSGGGGGGNYSGGSGGGYNQGDGDANQSWGNQQSSSNFGSSGYGNFGGGQSDFDGGRNQGGYGGRSGGGGGGYGGRR